MERNGLIRNGFLSFVFNRSQCSKCLTETGLPDELWHSEHSAHVCCLPHAITFAKAQLGTLDAEAVRAHGQFKLTKNNYTFTTCLLHALIPEIISQLFCFFFPVAIQHCPMKSGFTLHQITFWTFETLDLFFLCFHVQSRSSKKRKRALKCAWNLYGKALTVMLIIDSTEHKKRRVRPDASQYRITFSITGMRILDPRWTFQSVRLHPLSRWIIQLLDISC